MIIRLELELNSIPIPHLVANEHGITIEFTRVYCFDRQHSEDSDGESFRDSSSDVSSDYEPERGSLPKTEISQLSLNYQQNLALQEGFSSDEGESARPQSSLSFEYLERNQPWGREPLTDKVCSWKSQCFLSHNLFYPNFTFYLFL